MFARWGVSGIATASGIRDLALSPDTSGMTATHTIVQEFIYFRVAPDGTLHARVEEVPLPAVLAPDEHARQHFGWGPAPAVGALLHSTSWRARPEEAGLVLTWAVLPDPRPDLPAVPVGEPVIAEGTDGAHPVPEDLHPRHVIAHAARHLSFLSHTDPGVRDAIHAHPSMHDAFVAFAPDVAVNAEHQDGY